MKFIHAIVFTPNELSEGLIPTDWDEMCFGDYVIHAFYSVDQERVLAIDDNCHSSIESDIKAFLLGVYFATKQEPQVTKCYIIADDPYSPAQVAEKLKNKDFMEVI